MQLCKIYSLTTSSSMIEVPLNTISPTEKLTCLPVNPPHKSLDDLIDDVQTAKGDFEDVDTEIRNAVERGI